MMLFASRVSLQCVDVTRCPRAPVGDKLTEQSEEEEEEQEEEEQEEGTGGY